MYHFIIINTIIIIIVTAYQGPDFDGFSYRLCVYWCMPSS